MCKIEIYVMRIDSDMIAKLIGFIVTIVFILYSDPEMVSILQSNVLNMNEYNERSLPFTNLDSNLGTLHNYPNATNPTYDELLHFLLQDKTDKIPYSSSFVCADYAVRVHNNAEKSGIKAAVVSIALQTNVENHALNAFDTVDKGLIFIDCTNSAFGSYENSDTIVDVDYGISYQPQSLFDSDYVYEDMGAILGYSVYW